MNLVESLENLGLNEKEAKVYLALLQLGESTAYSIAKLSGLKKPTTYLILDQLNEKGFAIQIPRARKQLYKAESPDKCFALARKKLNLTEQMLPEFMALKRGKEEKTQVAYYEGLRGIKQMYEKMIKIAQKNPKRKLKIVGFYAQEKDTPRELLAYFEQLNEEFKKLNMTRKAITVYEPKIIDKYLNKLFLKQVNTQIKALDKNKYSSNISIEVYDRYVQIFSHRYIEGVIIENPDIAETLHQIFSMFWELTSRDKKLLKFSS